MPDTVVFWVEKLATRYRQLAAINFTFGLGVVAGDITNNTDNEVDNDIGHTIVEVVAAQDAEQQMEDNNDKDTNDDDSCETDKANYVGNNGNHLENSYGGVLTTEPTIVVQTMEP